MKSLIMGTAGHVDHGKTRLIGQLTGVNTDRLVEEQQRGISIELGFARLDLDGITLGIVDVPGHEKFVRTLVAGAGGMDMALLVVAADEGVMQQTREHVEVLDLLGVSRCVVALTKTDLVDPELAELAAEEVSEYLETTILKGSAIMPCSSETREGVDELRNKIAEVAAEVPERNSAGPFRLPIDRVFTMTGMGTVVTGTSWSGTVKIGDQLELLPRAIPVRVRGLQVHEQSTEIAHAGQRTALALHGVKHDELERGEVLCSAGRFKPSRMVTMKVTALDSSPWALKQRARIRFHFGTQELLGRMLLLDCEKLEPGGTALVQARMEKPAVCAPGDKVILRFYSPMRTVAGGIVIEAQAPKRRHGNSEDLEAVRLKEKGDPSEILERAIEDAGLAGMPASDAQLIVEKYPGDSPLPQLKESERVLQLGKRLFHQEPVESLMRGIEEIALKQQAARTLAWGPERESLRSALASSVPQASFQILLDHLAKTGRLRLKAERVRVGDADPEPTGQAAEWVAKTEREWAEAGLTPPNQKRFAEIGVPADYVQDVVNFLLDKGVLIRLAKDFLVHTDAVDTLRKGLADLFDEKEVIAVADVGQRFGISRKFSVPLLEYSDKQGWTVRREAERRRGPSL